MSEPCQFKDIIESVAGDKAHNIVGKCDDFLKSSQGQLLRTKYPDLTGDEVKLLHAYTLDSDFHKELNQGGKLKHPHAAKVFSSVLDKLPSKKTTVYRGIAKEVDSIDGLGDDKVDFNRSVVVSTTTNIDKAKAFAGKNGVVMEIEDASVVPIKDFSAFPGEEECALANNQVYKPDLYLDEELTAELLDEGDPRQGTNIVLVKALDFKRKAKKRLDDVKKNFEEQVKEKTAKLNQVRNAAERAESEIASQQKHSREQRTFSNDPQMNSMTGNFTSTRSPGGSTSTNGGYRQGSSSSGHGYGDGGGYHRGPHDLWGILNRFAPNYPHTAGTGSHSHDHSVSADISRPSTHAYYGNSFNEFQHANRGQGWTRRQFSENWAAHKRERGL